MKHFTIILAFLMTLSAPVVGQDFDKGWAAFKAGDYVTALKELRPLGEAEAGNKSIRALLGKIYEEGMGVPQDYKEALKWYKLAAEQGQVTAQNTLGDMYAIGQGTPQDYKEALKWYRLAAKQGFADAQDSLGYMYANGEGVPQDYKEALKWHRLAAEQGHAIAQNNLGFLYANGLGVLQDYTIAHMWFNIGSANGEEKATTTRDLLAKKMTPQIIETAQAMARECMSSSYTKCGE